MGHLPSKEVQKRLEEEDWDGLYPRLLHYAISLMSNRKWPGGHPPGAVEAEDLVQEAINSIFTGINQWNRQKHPDLEVVLKGIIKSKLSSIVELKDNQTRTALSENPGIDGWGHEAQGLFDSAQEILEGEELMDRIEAALEGDGDAEMVMLCLVEGATKPREISQESDLPVHKIYSILARIRNKVQKVIGQKQIGEKSDE